MNSDLDKILKQNNFSYALLLTVLFIVSAMMLAINNYGNRVTMAQNIANIIEEKIKTNQLRDVVKTLSSAQLENFKAISYYSSKGERLVTFPSSIDPSYFDKKSKLENWRYFTYSTNLFFDEEKKVLAGKIYFSIDPYGTIFQAALAWIFIFIIIYPFQVKFRKMVIKNFESKNIASRLAAIREVERQIRHDSRGVVHAIKAVVESSKNLDPLEVSTLKSAIHRLEGMISEQRRHSVKEVEEKIVSQKQARVHIHTAINDIITEKQALCDQNGVVVDFTYDQKSLALFLKISETDFKRILSNIFDNSLDAFKDVKRKHKKIKVNLEYKDDLVDLSISDNGIGIKDELLKNIGKKGFTLKPKGTGLGISYSKDKIESWGGNLKVESSYNKCTTTQITLPNIDPPQWATNSIENLGLNNIVAIDDDPSVIESIKNKFLNNSKNQIGFFEFSSVEDFLKEETPEEAIYIIDYDLGVGRAKGFEALKKIKNKGSVFMVSNNFDDFEVQNFCEHEGIKLYPKNLLGLGPPA